MSTLINSFDLTPFYIQSGYGIPNHFSTLGSEYTDLDTAIKYVNKNGLDYWVQMVDTTYPFSGGTVTGSTNFTNGLTANTISATTVIVDTTTVGHSFFTKVQSGFNVVFGTEISMDNLKVRINGTGGSGGLVQAGAVSGSFSGYTTLVTNVSGFSLSGYTNSTGITFTTTYANISASQAILSAIGDTTTLHLIDTTNSRIYRITAIHCQDTTGGYTSIERML
jgi:hypothetical protein